MISVDSIDSFEQLEETAKKSGVVLDITSWPQEVWINKIIVPKTLRGLGIGTCLIKHVIKLAGSRVVKLLACSCYGTEINELKQFYNHLGFVSYIEPGYKSRDYMMYSRD